jgi:hypothetical protein
VRTEGCDGGAILSIGLVAQHLALSIAFDASRIEHMHGSVLLNQVLGQSFPIHIMALFVIPT